VSLVAASGPFSPSDDLSYEPLEALLEACARQAPDVVVLSGPFLDCEHPAVAAGTLDETFESVFRGQVGQEKNLFRGLLLARSRLRQKYVLQSHTQRA
jgi:DNA polymerase alpha/epsilon subunit B